jgi:hypothetical protein
MITPRTRFYLMIIMISCGLLALPGCSSSADESGFPIGYYFKPRTPQGKSAITALRKRLDSRYISLGPSRFGREGDYEYLFVSEVSWESFGWEGMYHTSVLFFRSKGERDWTDAVVYYGISHAPDFNVLAFAKAHGHLLPLKNAESGPGE